MVICSLCMRCYDLEKREVNNSFIFNKQISNPLKQRYASKQSLSACNWSSQTKRESIHQVIPFPSPKTKHKKKKKCYITWKWQKVNSLWICILFYFNTGFVVGKFSVIKSGWSLWTLRPLLEHAVCSLTSAHATCCYATKLKALRALWSLPRLKPFKYKPSPVSSPLWSTELV